MERRDWTREQVELVVADYFSMLRLDLSNERVHKADHNRRLQASTGRTEKAIEFKHQNISAVLVNFGQPFLRGYPPRQHYQGLLEQAVLEWLAGDPSFFRSVADGPVVEPSEQFQFDAGAALADLVESPPEPVQVQDTAKFGTPVRFYRVDFARRDAENRRLGRLGEEFVLEFERRRLHDDERRPDLAQKVEWTSQERGDGAGFDISSFNGDESARLIEVKTTGLGKYSPFYVTRNEVRVSETNRAAFRLYRVFDYGRGPKLYQLNGPLSETCDLSPTLFSATPGLVSREPTDTRND